MINDGQWTIVDSLLGYNGISGFVPRKLGLPCQTITNISTINIYQLFYFYGHLDISSILWCLYIYIYKQTGSKHGHVKSTFVIILVYMWPLCAGIPRRHSSSSSSSCSCSCSCSCCSSCCCCCCRCRACRACRLWFWVWLWFWSLCYPREHRFEKHLGPLPVIFSHFLFFLFFLCTFCFAWFVAWFSFGFSFLSVLHISLLNSSFFPSSFIFRFVKRFPFACNHCEPSLKFICNIVTTIASLTTFWDVPIRLRESPVCILCQIKHPRKIFFL